MSTTQYFATKPFEADGRQCQAGDDVSDLPAGTLQSVIRTGLASTTVPTVTPVDSGDAGDSGDDADDADSQQSVPTVTPVELLDVPAEVIELLIGDGIRTVEGVEARLQHGPSLTEIKDIGKATESKIAAAVESLRANAGDE